MFLLSWLEAFVGCKTLAVVQAASANPGEGAVGWTGLDHVALADSGLEAVVAIVFVGPEYLHGVHDGSLGVADAEANGGPDALPGFCVDGADIVRRNAVPASPADFGIRDAAVIDLGGGPGDGLVSDVPGVTLAGASSQFGTGVVAVEGIGHGRVGRARR